jgi:ketosteroid isomerase-like protein
MADGNDLPNVIRTYLDSCDAMTLDRLAGCLAADIVYDHRSNAGPSAGVVGAEAVLRLAERNFRALRRRRHTVHGIVADGDRVAVELEVEMVAAEVLPNGWQPGQTIRLSGVSVFTLRGDKIAGLRDYL